MKLTFENYSDRYQGTRVLIPYITALLWGPRDARYVTFEFSFLWFNFVLRITGSQAIYVRE